MLVVVNKRKTSVLGTPLFKGTQLEISPEQYEMYRSEFSIISDEKVKKKDKVNIKEE